MNVPWIMFSSFTIDLTGGVVILWCDVIENISLGSLPREIQSSCVQISVFLFEAVRRCSVPLSLKDREGSVLSPSIFICHFRLVYHLHTV